jgi:hypothetical protein
MRGRAILVKPRASPPDCAAWRGRPQRSVATHRHDARFIRVFRRFHPCAESRALFGSIKKQPMNRPSFFIFPASSDHIVDGNNGERLGRTVTAGIETHEVVGAIDNSLNTPIPMRKSGNEVFADEHLKFLSDRSSGSNLSRRLKPHEFHTGRGCLLRRRALSTLARIGGFSFSGGWHAPRPTPVAVAFKGRSVDFPLRCVRTIPLSS